MTDTSITTTPTSEEILQQFQEQLPKLEDFGYDPATLNQTASSALQPFLTGDLSQFGNSVFDDSVGGPLTGDEEGQGIPMTGLFTLGDGSSVPGQLRLLIADTKGDTYIAAGKTDFTNTENGFIIGLDDSDSDKVKFYVGSSTNYLNWDGAALTINGSITATTGTIGGWTIGATSLSSSNITIDSSTPRILISDGTNNRILIGKQTGGF